MITTLTNRIQYIAGGSSPDFAVPYAFYSQDHLEVYQNGVLRSIGTHYTVTPESNTPSGTVGGEVTFIITPPVNDVILILRVVPLSQLADLKDLSIFPADVVEAGLDLEVMRVQQHEDDLSRAITAPITETPSNLTLPDIDTRKNKFFAFDGAGDPIAAVGTSANLGPVSAFMDTLLDDADATAARATLQIAGGTVLTKVATYTVVAGDAGAVILCDGTFDLNLTAFATLGSGFFIDVVNKGTGVITINPNGAETINGSATMLLLGTASARVFTDGSAGYGTMFSVLSEQAFMFSLLGN